LTIRPISSRPSGGEVHDIRACGENAQVFELWQVLNVRAGDFGLVGQEDFGCGSTAEDFGRRSALINFAGTQRFEFLPTQVTGV